MKTGMFQRSVDAGHGRQTVLVIDGVVKAQWLSPGYTGDGNREWVGQPIAAVQEKAELHPMAGWDEAATREEWAMMEEA